MIGILNLRKKRKSIFARVIIKNLKWKKITKETGKIITRSTYRWNNWTKFRKWITGGEFVHFRSTIDTSRNRTRRIQFIIFNFVKNVYVKYVYIKSISSLYQIVKIYIIALQETAAEIIMQSTNKSYLHWRGIGTYLYSQLRKLLLISRNMNYPRKNLIYLKKVNVLQSNHIKFENPKSSLPLKRFIVSFLKILNPRKPKVRYKRISPLEKQQKSTYHIFLIFRNWRKYHIFVKRKLKKISYFL